MKTKLPRLNTSNLEWDGNSLVLTTTKKRRVLAEYVGASEGSFKYLKTFWKESGYFIGLGKSLILGVEAETYWSRVQGQTYLIHFDPLTGSTAVRPDNSRGGKFLTCKRIGGSTCTSS